MKKRMHPSYLKALLTVSAVLFLICASTVIIGSVWGKKNVSDDLDKKLERRLQKLFDVDEYTSQMQYERYANDYDKYIDEMSIWSGILSQTDNLANINADPEKEPSFSITRTELEVSYWAADETETGEDREFYEMTEDQPGILVTDEREYYEKTEDQPVILVTDEEGDVIVIWNGYVTVSLRDYCYFYTNYTDLEYQSKIGDSLNGINSLSEGDSHMKVAALDILTDEDITGWFEDYRYCTWQFRFFIDEEHNRMVVMRELPYDMNYLNPDVSGLEESYSQRFVLFEDGSAELSEYRSETTRLTIVMLIVWAALTAVTAAVLLIILKPSEKGASWIRLTSDGRPVDPELLSEFGPQAQLLFKGSAASEKIPEDMADELLAYISQNETSVGPNGYLDQMRDLINVRRSDAAEKRDDPEQ